MLFASCVQRISQFPAETNSKEAAGCFVCLEIYGLFARLSKNL